MFSFVERRIPRLPTSRRLQSGSAFRVGSRSDGPSPTALGAGIAALGIVWGAIVAVSGLNALYLCVSLIGCVFVLRDFRVGVVLLILLMPISGSNIFPHEMLGLKGLNPLNLLLTGTLFSCLLHALFGMGLRGFLPKPLFWLYIVPLLVAGANGVGHVHDIAPGFFIYQMLDFHDAGGYLMSMVLKPLLMVVFALLVGAAVVRSPRPERFLVPALISVWVMSVMVIIFVFAEGMALGDLARDDARGFLSTLGMHANDLGRLYAVAYALLLFTWAEIRDTGLRLVLLASMGLVIVALLLTFSRGAFFSFALVNIIFLMWRRNAKSLFFLALLAALALLLIPDAVYERLATGFGSGANAISAGRIEGLWLPLLPEILRSPIYGNGLGSILWSDAMREAGGATVIGATHPHNAYLQAILDVGVAGLLLLCAYFAHVWNRLRELSTDSSLSPTLRGFYQGAAAGLASFLIAAITDGSLFPRPEQAFLWLAIGMMYGQSDMHCGRVQATVHET